MVEEQVGGMTEQTVTDYVDRVMSIIEGSKTYTGIFGGDGSNYPPIGTVAPVVPGPGTTSPSSNAFPYFPLPTSFPNIPEASREKEFEIALRVIMRMVREVEGVNAEDKLRALDALLLAMFPDGVAK